MSKRILLDFLIPVLLLVAATAIIARTDADMRIERSFYQPGQGWVYANDEPWQLLYKYGMVPGLALGIFAAVVLLLSFVWKRAADHRRRALFLVVLLALGPGLVTSAFKDYWGRPRPRQVETLGGEQKYLQVWQTGVSGQGKSFFSGHASIAFYLIAPFFVLRRSSSAWGFSCLALGLAYGALMGLARMVQGGHFLSDVLWSAGFVYLLGLILSYAFLEDIRNPG